MSPLDEVQFQGRIATSPFKDKYGDDGRSRQCLRADHGPDHARPGRLPPAAAVAAGADPATRRTRDHDAGPAEARDRAPGQGDGGRREKQGARRERKAAAKAKLDADKARQRSIDNAIRTGGRVATSRLGQDIVRGILGTLFGGGKGR